MAAGWGSSSASRYSIPSSSSRCATASVTRLEHFPTGHASTAQIRRAGWTSSAFAYVRRVRKCRTHRIPSLCRAQWQRCRGSLALFFLPQRRFHVELVVRTHRADDRRQQFARCVPVPQGEVERSVFGHGAVHEHVIARSVSHGAERQAGVAENLAGFGLDPPLLFIDSEG